MTIDRMFLRELALPLAQAAYSASLPGLPAGTMAMATIGAPLFPQFGFMATDGATLYVVLRGTLTGSEWLEDFDDIAIDVGGFRVHEGFQRVFEALQPSIRAGLANNRLPVCVIGHSLGAAVAQLVAHSIGAEACVVFASPRVGDGDWKARIEASVADIVRVSNTRDIVTHVPPRPAFTHAGKAVVFDGWANARSASQRLDAHFEHSLEQSYGPGVRGMPDALALIELS